jgi:hypothetical protein
MDWTTIIETILAPLGISAVLAVFLYLAWRRLDAKDVRNDELLRRKDETISSLNDTLVEKFEENTEVQQGVKSALEKNTEVMEKVLDRFSETMRSGVRS